METALQGSLAPPMSNGELAFEELWQGRVFGMATALCDAGCYEWSEFQAKLIEAIAEWDRSAGGEYAYYDHFLTALERLLQEKRLVVADAIDERSEVLAARPHGHDH